MLVAWATGGSLTRALAFAAGFFVLATAWSWWRWRQRIEQERRKLPETGTAARREAP